MTDTERVRVLEQEINEALMLTECAASLKDMAALCVDGASARAQLAARDERIKALEAEIEQGGVKMTRNEILDTAKTLINNDRAATHGDAYKMHEVIAEMWSAILGVEISATQVALMMAALKLARASENPDHSDNWVDAAGYIALAGEMAGETPE